MALKGHSSPDSSPSLESAPGAGKTAQGASRNTQSINRAQEISVFLLILATLFLAGASGGMSWPTLLFSLLAIGLRAIGLRFSTRAGCGLLLAVVGLVPLYLYFGTGLLELGIRDLLITVLMVFVLSARTGRDFAALSSYCLWILLASLFPASGPSQWLAVGAVFGWFLFVQSLNEIRRSAEDAVSPAWGGWRSFVPLTALLAIALLGVGAIATALYLTLPRNPIQAWNFQFQPARRLVGFSNSVRIGEIGELQRDRTPAFRVRFLDGAPPPLLRWRGTALADFNGYAWMNKLESWREFPGQNRLNIASDAQRRLPGARLFYEVQNLAAMERVMFSLGVAEYAFLPAGRLRANGEGSLRQWVDDSALGAYSLSVWLGPLGNFDPHPAASDLTERLSPTQLERYTRLPVLHPKIHELAETITALQPGAYRKAAAVEEHLRTNYGYSLQSGIGGREPLLDFLFITKAGHCEYFASAMAVLLRSVGVPARVVTGFYSALPEPIGEWHVIRSSDAHSWVEVYVEGRGWLAFDPTPPGSGESLPQWAQMFRRWEDRLLVFSEDWMGGYSGLRRPTIPSLPELSLDGAKAWLSTASLRSAWPWLLGLALLPGLLLWRRRRPVSPKHSATELFETFLVRSALTRSPHQTAREAAAAHPAVFRAYERARFSRDPQALGQLRRTLDDYAATQPSDPSRGSRPRPNQHPGG